MQVKGKLSSPSCTHPPPHVFPMCASSKNAIIIVAAQHRPCVQVQRTLSSPSGTHPPPHPCQDTQHRTMCASFQGPSLLQDPKKSNYGCPNTTDYAKNINKIKRSFILFYIHKIGSGYYYTVTVYKYSYNTTTDWSLASPMPALSLHVRSPHIRVGPRSHLPI